MFLSVEKPREIYNGETLRCVQVEMNNSLYRQIEAAETKYFKFQDAMANWLEEVEAGRLKRISNG